MKVNNIQYQLIERFSVECRETKRKAITKENQQKEKKPHEEPMRTQSKYKPTAKSGKRGYKS